MDARAPGSAAGRAGQGWVPVLSWRRGELKDRAGTLRTFDPRLPWTEAEESAAIVQQVSTTYEMFHAVRAYAKVLQRLARGDARRIAVVAEANAGYNWLVSWDNNNSSLFSEELERQGIGGIIRRAGRRR
ncbi:MAG: hypothetical protein ABIT38_21935 [Gemmatimonadaceae bacterium]